ncbi:MAG: condensation domain-containing protein, partial [Ktedonobacteraceae bacterium]
DLVRFLADGVIEFLGRIDQQVKLRGFRIEPGEIEAVLNAHSAVREVIIRVREDRPGDKRLVAYIVAHDANPPVPTQLRAFLESRLPSYMIPSAFLFLEQFPLTVNGKIDQRALPAPDVSILADSRPFIAPQTHLEQRLADIWCDVLHVPQVSMRDYFFELGGDSLLAMQVISRMRARLSIELPLRDLFANPCIAELTEILLERIGPVDQVFPEITLRKASDPLVLSFAQQRLWFLNQLDPGNPSYTTYAALRLPRQINVDVLRQSLQALVQRHEILRATFTSLEGEPRQVFTVNTDVPLTIYDFSDRPTKERLEEAIFLVTQDIMTPFDLTKGPLLRVTLFHLAPEEHVLLLTIHHI